LDAGDVRLWKEEKEERGVEPKEQQKKERKKDTGEELRDREGRGEEGGYGPNRGSGAARRRLPPFDAAAVGNCAARRSGRSPPRGGFTDQTH
jgi:hypothetical protein